MGPWLKNILILAALCCECRGDSVSQPKGVEMATEGGQITLACHYETDDPSPYLFWYKQGANDYPKYMLMRQTFGTGDNATEFKERFHADLDANSKSVPLTIQRVQMSDSAVYYCALRSTTGGGDKIIFGTGTRLIIESRDKQEPSYYNLSDNNVTACLATDFSAHNANDNVSWFEGAEATRMNGDSYYSQVSLRNNCIAEGGSEKCEADWYFDTDAKINFLSLTILGLRVLFLKTIVFNVLMTLRLWMS